MLPNRVSMDRYTPPPEPLVHIFMYVCWSPHKGALLQNGEKHLVTVHGTPRRRKAYIRVQWSAAWFPKEIVNDTAISIPVPCSPQHDTFHLGLGRPESRQPACRSNPHQGIPSTIVTTSHVTQRRVRIYDTPRYGRAFGFMGIGYNIQSSGVTRNFFRGGGGSTNSIEDRDGGDLGAVAP